MALYKYRKVEEYYNPKSDLLILESGENKRTNAWNSTAQFYSGLKSIANSSVLAHVLIPGLFIFLGAFFIFLHFLPDIQIQLGENNNIFNQGNTSLVSEGFIDNSGFISNPAGLINFDAEAAEEKTFERDDISRNYNKTFYITIPSIGIDSLPVTPNVNSSSKSAYDTVLKNSLAHFKGTGLPISDVDNNIVIYGHSANANYGPQPNDPEVAFSFIHKMKVGDEIYIDMDGERYKFRMYKGQVVEPTDVEIIEGVVGKKTLTLFTCHEPGNNTKRYVVTARPID
jgi:LPXTG-site transpeptidase (sortase) family protein